MTWLNSGQELNVANLIIFFKVSARVILRKITLAENSLAHLTKIKKKKS